jgi:hypothetical protein
MVYLCWSAVSEMTGRKPITFSIRALGADHPDTLASRSTLGYAYESAAQLGGRSRCTSRTSPTGCGFSAPTTRTGGFVQGGGVLDRGHDGLGRLTAGDAGPCEVDSFGA